MPVSALSRNDDIVKPIPALPLEFPAPIPGDFAHLKRPPRSDFDLGRRQILDWFKAHPRRNYYARPAMRGEWIGYASLGRPPAIVIASRDLFVVGQVAADIRVVELGMEIRELVEDYANGLVAEKIARGLMRVAAGNLGLQREEWITYASAHSRSVEAAVGMFEPDRRAPIG